MYKKSNQLNQDHTSKSNMSYSEFLNKYDYFWRINTQFGNMSIYLNYLIYK